MEKKLDLTHLLNEDDYSAIPYGLKLIMHEMGFDVEIDPLNPHDPTFSFESSTKCYFEVTETEFYFVIKE
ncbi:a-gt.5 conserved hypothetical protein [Acinetobacter phage Ac42]|uniref:a-gt.5 conserved hypothetical protein n=1 Tax=Acinetobacter phage Ac42 TaxID=762660 RepID=UPI0001EBCD07|nr:a-gt.5 conserved hypothetical protein [Acinetobacter phage Ac42]ADI96347.1 a-gt.5 conserved hypothetical protein [Acinetobacter phage Ac42]